MKETRDTGFIPGSERSPGEGSSNPLCILAWRIPWTEKPGRLQSMGLQTVRHNWATKQQQQCQLLSYWFSAPDQLLWCRDWDLINLISALLAESKEGSANRKQERVYRAGGRSSSFPGGFLQTSCFCFLFLYVAFQSHIILTGVIPAHSYT